MISWCCIPSFRKKSDNSDDTYFLPLSVRSAIGFLPNLTVIAAMYSFTMQGTSSFDFSKRTTVKREYHLSE